MLILISSIVILLAISAFFSGSETGLTGSSSAKIHKLKLEGNKKAERVSKLRENKESLIGAILLGNNAVNILATVFASNVAVKLYGADYNEFALTIIMTLLVLVFAEVMPKTYAFRNAERVALKVAPVLQVVVFVFSPITRAVQFLADSIFAIFFRTPNIADEDEPMDGTDVLRGAIEFHHDEGEVIKDDRDMLGSILDLSDTEVGAVMVHRKEIKAIDIASSNEQIIEYMLSSPYSRIPFWKGDSDNIVGVLHNKFLMRALHEHRDDLEELDISSILKEPWFVPENRLLVDQLKAFREEHNHFAFVVDEYGALQGMLTLEDIIEEIVGQIEEESGVGEVESHDIVAETDGSYCVDGQVSIRDLNREMDWNLPDEEATTLAGLVINKTQLIPEKGQIFHFYGFRFEIMQKERNQLIKIRVCKVAQDS